MNAHQTLGNILLTAGEPANAPTSATITGGTVTVGAGVLILLAAVALIKIGTGKLGWVLLAVAGVMLAGTQIGGQVGQIGGQIAQAGVTAVSSLFSS